MDGWRRVVFSPYLRGRDPFVAGVLPRHSVRERNGGLITVGTPVKCSHASDFFFFFGFRAMYFRFPSVRRFAAVRNVP